MRRLLVSLFALALVLGASVVACGGDSDSSAVDVQAFCDVAVTSEQSRTEDQINSYYDELGEVAPPYLQADLETLRSGWKSVSFSLGGGDDLSRPPEVSDAARNVLRTVFEECQYDGGVYLVMPEAGL